MNYTTPRKAANPLGAAHAGTAHHWAMTVSAIGLALLTPAFIMVIGGAIGLPQEAVIVYFSRPYPAIVTALFMIAGMIHFMQGTQIMIDDYFQDTARKAALVVSRMFGWAVIACVVYALVRMAFFGVVMAV